MASNQMEVDYANESLIDCLPLEILQQIFINLGLSDIIHCSKVCLIWREVANSNRIWLNMCSKAGIENKKLLKEENRLVHNPLRHLREADPFSHRMSPHCNWKLHFVKYKYLENNWRLGHNTRLNSTFRMTYYKDRIGVGVISTSLMKLFDVNEQFHPMNLADAFESRVPTEVCVRMEYPDMNVDKISIENGLVFYVKKYYIICIKKIGKSFQTIYNVKIKNSNRLDKNNVLRDSKRLIVHFTARYIFVIDIKHPCKLLICNTNTGTLEKEVDINFSGKPLRVIKPNCMTVFDDKVYVSLTCGTKHFIACYDIHKAVWFLTLDLKDQAFELMASKRFICAKNLLPNHHVDELEVFTLNFQYRKQHYITNKDTPIVLTEDDVLIFSDNFTFYVRGLDEHTNIDYCVTTNGKVEQIIPILNDFVIINNSMSLQLWDWKRAEHMQTFLRANIISLWADESTLAVNISDERKGTVLSFW